MRLFITHWR